MKYFSIFQELFESDSIIFMLIGLVPAVIIGIKMNEIRKNMVGFVSSFALYAVCELFSNLYTSYMAVLILLFAGTIAIGGMVGFLISTVVVKVRKR